MDALARWSATILPVGLVYLPLLAAGTRIRLRWRLPLHLGLFVLLRDAMATAGLWQLDRGSLRFTATPPVLLCLSLMALVLLAILVRLESGPDRPLRWHDGNVRTALLHGAGGALFLATLVTILRHAWQLPALPPPAPYALPAILLFALAGNTYAECLFRGLLLQRLAGRFRPDRAVLLAAGLFCVCHAPLALQHPQTAPSLFVFTLVEGIVAGVIWLRGGLLAASLCHGGGIFLLASGWL